MSTHGAVLEYWRHRVRHLGAKWIDHRRVGTELDVGHHDAFVSAAYGHQHAHFDGASYGSDDAGSGFDLVRDRGGSHRNGRLAGGQQDERSDDDGIRQLVDGGAACGVGDASTLIR